MNPLRFIKMPTEDKDWLKVRDITIEEQLKTRARSTNGLFGQCIKVSDAIVARINKETKCRAKAKQVWVLYEKFEGCSDCCYEEHWLVEVHFKSHRLFIDATIEQFQWAFTREMPTIYWSEKLPNFYLNHEPKKTILDRCGWNDWYEYGDYVNNFNYYGDK